MESHKRDLKSAQPVLLLLDIRPYAIPVSRCNKNPRCIVLIAFRANSSQNYLSFSFLVFFMRFRVLSDYGWGVIRPLLPPRSRVGRPRADNRVVLNGILYVLTTGCRWMDMPLEYGSYKTAWRRLKRWQDEGVWYERLASTYKALTTIASIIIHLRYGI
jgi:hypothetical protein